MFNLAIKYQAAVARFGLLLLFMGAVSARAQENDVPVVDTAITSVQDSATMAADSDEADGETTDTTKGKEYNM